MNGTMCLFLPMAPPASLGVAVSGREGCTQHSKRPTVWQRRYGIWHQPNWNHATVVRFSGAVPCQAPGPWHTVFRFTILTVIAPSLSQQRTQTRQPGVTLAAAVEREWKQRLSLQRPVACVSAQLGGPTAASGS